MKILHLVASSRWSGGAVPAFELALAQRALGHELFFACVPGRGLARRAAAAGLSTVHGIRFAPLGWLRGEHHALRRFVREQNIDVIHSHLSRDHGLAALALGRAWGAAPPPLIVRTINAPPRGLFRRRLVARSADGCFVASRADAATLESIGLPSARIALLPGAVDIHSFAPGRDDAGLRARLGVPPDAPVVGMVARMRPGRGHLELVAGLDAILARLPDAHAIIAGTGELEDELKRRLAAHPRGDRVHLAGHLGDNVRQLYAAADVLLMTAPGSDATCRGALEAMACGRPVVAVRRGALAEIVEEGKTGWLVEPLGTEEDLGRTIGETLGKALSNRARLAEMGNAARAQVEREHTFQIRAMRAVKQYEGWMTK